ncbi:MAG: bacillithiol system redox-active protein YtxJ [Ginsengibacter sp.]
MNWISLQDEKQLDEIIAASNIIPQIIFKHSTRCGTSSMVKNRLDKNEAPPGINFYLLDLLKHRSLSNKIASEFGVYHQSPQVLVIDNGKCVYNESHSGIVFDEIEAAAKQK